MERMQEYSRAESKRWYSKPWVEVSFMLAFVVGTCSFVLIAAATYDLNEPLIAPPIPINTGSFCGSLSCATLEQRLQALEAAAAAACDYQSSLTVVGPDNIEGTSFCGVAESPNGHFNIIRVMSWCDNPQGVAGVYDPSLESGSLSVEYACNNVPTTVEVVSFTVDTTTLA